MTKRTQLEVAGIVVFLAVLILIYGYATYFAYNRCDHNYGKFAGEIMEQAELLEHLENPEYNGIGKKIILFRPSRRLYSGYNDLLLHAGIGWGLMAIGFLLGIDTLRGKNKPSES